MDSLSVKIWFGEISITEADYPYQLSLLNKDEQRQAENFKNDPLRRRYVANRAKLREILAQVVDCNSASLRIDTGQHGKPFLADYPEIDFNLSHTGNKIAVAIGHRCQVGIDIELCKSRSSLSALVEKCFGDEEKVYWKQLSETVKTQEFYRFWTRKEAFVKATGRGIALGLTSCVINPSRPGTFLRIPEEFGLPSEWRIHDMSNLNDTSIAGALVIKTDKKLSIEQLFI
jgi:4'-phosphopantetheinyl transferase